MLGPPRERRAQKLEDLAGMYEEILVLNWTNANSPILLLLLSVSRRLDICSRSVGQITYRAVCAVWGDPPQIRGHPKAASNSMQQPRDHVNSTLLADWRPSSSCARKSRAFAPSSSSCSARVLSPHVSFQTCFSHSISLCPTRPNIFALVCVRFKSAFTPVLPARSLSIMSNVS